MNIITLEELKDYFSINNPQNDAKLEPLVGYVNEYISGFCSLPNEETTVTRTSRLSSPSGRNVVLPSTNVSTIVSVTSNGKVLDEEDYYLDVDSGILVFYIEVTTKMYGILVEYTEEAFTAPADLKFAALELALYFYKTEYKTAMSSSQGESVTFEISKTVPNKIRHILVQHRML